jgi:hypothetical protein
MAIFKLTNWLGPEQRRQRHNPPALQTGLKQAPRTGWCYPIIRLRVQARRSSAPPALPPEVCVFMDRSLQPAAIRHWPQFRSIGLI